MEIWALQFNYVRHVFLLNLSTAVNRVNNLGGVDQTGTVFM